MYHVSAQGVDERMLNVHYYYIISLFPHLHTPFPTFSPSLISLMVSVDVKHHVHLPTCSHIVRAGTCWYRMGAILKIRGFQMTAKG